MNTTVKKIKPYKFVSTAGIVTATKGTSGANSTAKVLEKNVQAINSVGSTLNGLISAFNDFIKLQKESLGLEQNLARQAQDRVDVNVNSVGGPQQETRRTSGVSAFIKGAAKSFWEGLLDMFQEVTRLLVVVPALKWLADPANFEKITKALQTFGDVFRAIFDWFKGRVFTALDGLMTMIDGDKDWKDRLIGFLKFFVAMGAMMLAFRWLKNPFKIIGDIINVFKGLGQFVKNAGRMLKSRAGRWGLAITALGTIGAELFAPDQFKPSNLAKTVVEAAGLGMPEQKAIEQSIEAGEQEQPTKEPVKSDRGGGATPGSQAQGTEPARPTGVPQAEKGGDINVNVPAMSMGGLISGPDSGYPVSLTGKGVDFIGHGTELVMPRFERGGAFVVPLNNRATRRNPGLTSKRFSEAFRGGFGGPKRESGGKIPKFEQGGFLGRLGSAWNTLTGRTEKPKGSTVSEKKPPNNGATAGQFSNLPAVQAVGRMILAKGFTVAEHPNFKKNNFSGSGANSGGWDASGKQRVGGHSGGSLHYSGLALDVTDWRSGDWKSRTKALANEVYKNRKKLKLSQIIHDGWGYWFHPNSSYTPGAYGGHDTHLHLGFLRGKADNDAQINGAGAGDIGGDMSTNGPSDITGANTEGAQLGTTTETWVPTSIKDSMAGLNLDFSYATGAPEPATLSGYSVNQAREQAVASQDAKAMATVAVATQASVAAAAQAAKVAQASQGAGQEIAIPLGGDGGGTGTYLDIAYYAPKFGLFHRV